MRVLLLVSAFNSLSQRIWCALRESGHDVGVLIADGAVVEGVRAAAPELILCPYLTEPVPAEVWRNWRTVIIRPGPVGDRGPWPLDRAIADGARSWGVTAMQASEEPGAGPVWASRTFALPVAPARKSSLYLGPVADAAMDCVQEVLGKAANPEFRPVTGDGAPGGWLSPAMRESDRAVEWELPTEQILRRIRAADGAPGVRTQISGLEVLAFDAHAGLARDARPGALLGRRQGAVLVGTGDGAIWLGHLRTVEPGARKLPATRVLGRRLREVPHAPLPAGAEGEAPAAYRQVRYRRTARVGWLAFDFYNGAMSAGHARRLLNAFRHAAEQDTEVLVLRGATDVFSTGLHLTLTDAAADPAVAAWDNVKAINAVCKEIIACVRQVVVAAYSGGASAGGAMLGLGADVVAARAGIVLNPYYDLGLYGSELHTLTLPRRVGSAAAHRLIDDKLPISAERAMSLGLVDQVGPRHPETFTRWLTELADALADPRAARVRRSAKARRLAADRVPLDAYEARELAEMTSDLYSDRNGFFAARTAFVGKQPPGTTPERLLFDVAPPVSAQPAAA